MTTPMFNFLALIVIPIIIGVIAEKIIKKPIGVLVWFISLTIIFFVSFYTTISDQTINYTYKNKTSIYSLEDNLGVKGSINGSFVLGCGSINGQTDTNLCYFVMSGDKENGYSVTKYDASEVKVFPEDNIEQPYYIEKYEQINETYYIWWNIIELHDNYPEKLIKKELHLQKNYIKQNYNIDMK